MNKLMSTAIPVTNNLRFQWKDQYQAPIPIKGCKARIAHRIIDWLPLRHEPMFHDLCCGSGAVSIALVEMGYDPKKIVMVDASPWGDFWRLIGTGLFRVNRFRNFINLIPTDKRRQRKFLMRFSTEWRQAWVDEYDSHVSLYHDYLYAWLILQAASFSGQVVDWQNHSFHFHGLRKYRKGHPVFKPSLKTLAKRVEFLVYRMTGVTGFQAHVHEHAEQTWNHTPGTNHIVYLDPPYSNVGNPTSKSRDYPYQVNTWEFVTRLHHPTYVSYYRKVSPTAVLISSGNKNRISNMRGGPHSRQEWLNGFHFPHKL